MFLKTSVSELDKKLTQKTIKLVHLRYLNDSKLDIPIMKQNLTIYNCNEKNFKDSCKPNYRYTMSNLRFVYYSTKQMNPANVYQLFGCTPVDNHAKKHRKLRIHSTF